MISCGGNVKARVSGYGCRMRCATVSANDATCDGHARQSKNAFDADFDCVHGAFLASDCEIWTVTLNLNVTSSRL
jgi:hypothetical protein